MHHRQYPLDVFFISLNTFQKFFSIGLERLMCAMRTQEVPVLGQGMAED
jgi:hypothetical protein